MEIKTVRKIFTKNSTTSEYHIDGIATGILNLEPTDLGLDDTMDEAKIKDIKAKHFAVTKEYVAIPTGKAYKLVMYAPPIDFMKRFTLFADGKIKEIPLFEGIKGYGGVFIHPGAIETAQHQQSEGCNMPALKMGTTPDTTSESNEGWLLLMSKISDAIKAGTATFETIRDVEAWGVYSETMPKY